MGRINLATIAKGNQDALIERYEEAVGIHPQADRVRAFREECEGTWTVFINSWAFQLLFFLTNDLPYNKYRFVQQQEGGVMLPFAEHVAGSSTIDWASFWKVLQRDPRDADFAPRRRAFNQTIDQEEEFSYSAYFVQGKGAGDFGEFSMLLRRECLMAMKEVSFLIKDSLQDYLLEDGTCEDGWRVDVDRIYLEAATTETVTRLMCMKLGKELESLDLPACRELVCTKDDYLEGQLAERFGCKDIAQVRVKALTKERMRLLNDLRAAGKLEEKDENLTLDESRVRDFHKALGMMQTKNMEISYI